MSSFGRILRQNTTFIAGEDLPPYRRVLLNGETLTLAGADDLETGVISKEAPAGSVVTVEVLEANNVYPLVLTGTLSSNDAVYRAAEGKVSNTGSSRIGRATQAATNKEFAYTLVEPTSASSIHGWLDYNNTSGDFQVSANTWATVTNNGAGAFTNLGYGPDGVLHLVDTVAGGLTFEHLKLGDSIFIRNDITITPTVNGATVEFRYELGGGAGLYTLPRYWGALNNGAGFPSRFVEEDYIYMGDTNTLNNPGTLQIRVSEDSTVNNAGCVVLALIQ